MLVKKKLIYLVFEEMVGTVKKIIKGIAECIFSVLDDVATNIWKTRKEKVV